MIKKIFLFLVILVIAATAAIYFLGAKALNKGIKNAVETVGPQITQTAVRLDTVDLSVLSGKGTLKGLYIGNPEGFQSENMFALGQIDIAVDTASLFGDTIIIEKIYIQKPEISYEKTLMSSNMKQLLKNIKEFAGVTESEATEPSTESEPKTETNPEGTQASAGTAPQVIIKQFIIEEGTIFVGMIGEGTTVKLPRIELNDLGGPDQNIAAISELVLSEILKAVSQAEGADGVINKASETIKGLFGK